MEKIEHSRPDQASDDLLTPYTLESLLLDHPLDAALLKKVGYGLIGAAYTCTVLTAVLAFAVVVAVGGVRMWSGKPVVVEESLFFDYTEFRPHAEFSFGGGAKALPASNGVPVGHAYHVSVALVLPESDYNRHLGVFQVTAEVISATGTVMARSSQPCMLQYRSYPVRLARGFLMGVPLLFGAALEAQTITVNLLRYHEVGKRTESIRVTLSPRAGTLSLPELYESRILILSQLPWPKELVHSWKWTLYVWTSMYVYIVLLVIMMCCFRSLVFLDLDVGGNGATGEAEDGDAETEDGLGLGQLVEGVGDDGSLVTSVSLPEQEGGSSVGWVGEEEEEDDNDEDDEGADSSMVDDEGADSSSVCS